MNSLVSHPIRSPICYMVPLQSNNDDDDNYIYLKKNRELVV